MKESGYLNRQSLIITLVVSLILLVFYGSFLTHKINLVTADLGRHLKNGELFFQTWRPIATNFYSSTEPDFPTLNHHWGGGALFYLIWKASGFTGVQLSVVALNLAAFLIAFLIARKKAGLAIATFIAIIIIPLLAERTEIRPESFSYLLSMLFFWILLRNSESSAIDSRILFFLPFLELIWVNTHIYFFLGPLIILAFFIETFFVSELRVAQKKLFLALILVVGAACINPFGLRGVIAPFTIFRNYGYRLVENQTVWFIEKLIPSPNYVIFKFVFLLLAASFVCVLIFRRKVLRVFFKEESLIPFLLLAGGVSLMAWLQIRNFALFGFFALPILSANIRGILRVQLQKYEQRESLAALLVSFLVFLITISSSLQSIFPRWHGFGLGVEDRNSASVDFFRNEHIKGPLLNNYDIGGYLIYYLFPDTRVFVDNRPEAYSVDFFQKIYIPLQESETIWREKLASYGFNAIIFSYHDATPWGQNFLVARVKDPEWVPVFVDQQVIIFVRNREQNEDIIRRYAIPREHIGIK